MHMFQTLDLKRSSDGGVEFLEAMVLTQLSVVVDAHTFCSALTMVLSTSHLNFHNLCPSLPVLSRFGLTSSLLTTSRGSDKYWFQSKQNLYIRAEPILKR